MIEERPIDILHDRLSKLQFIRGTVLILWFIVLINVIFFSPEAYLPVLLLSTFLIFPLTILISFRISKLKRLIGSQTPTIEEHTVIYPPTTYYHHNPQTAYYPSQPTDHSKI